MQMCWINESRSSYLQNFGSIPFFDLVLLVYLRWVARRARKSIRRRKSDPFIWIALVFTRARTARACTWNFDSFQKYLVLLLCWGRNPVGEIGDPIHGLLTTTINTYVVQITKLETCRKKISHQTSQKRKYTESYSAHIQLRKKSGPWLIMAQLI